MNSNNNGCHLSDCDCQQRSNGKFNCTDPFRAIDASCIPPTPKEETVAYGSFYDSSENFVDVTPVTPPSLGQKVIFSTPGPLLGVTTAPVPNNTTDLQVATSGVYEISMNISALVNNVTSDPFPSSVRFGLFINDTILATESNFESFNSMTNGDIDPAVTLFMMNTIGTTIQLRLNNDDRLSIRVISAEGQGHVFYRFPSLVVNKIAD